MRRFLNSVYDGAAVLAAFCLCAMLVVIVLQMAARWTGIAFPGSSEYAGYLMAASSFLAFAHTLNRGAQRVTLSCAGGRCEPTATPGDDQKIFEAASGQSSAHQAAARSVAVAQAPKE